MEIHSFPKDRLIAVARRFQQPALGAVPGTPPDWDIFLRGVWLAETLGEVATIEELSFSLSSKGEEICRRSYGPAGLAARCRQAAAQVGALPPPMLPFVFGGPSPLEGGEIAASAELAPGQLVGLMYEHFILPSDADPGPDALVVRARYLQRGERREASLALAIETYAPPVPLRLPLSGPCYVWTGYDNAQMISHRRLQSQEFALDIVTLQADGRYHPTSGWNQDYACHGAPVLAAAAGEVVERCDTYPENPGRDQLLDPAEISRLAETHGLLPSLTGNYVTIRHSEGLYSNYAHLIPGSIPVAPGDRVESGQRVGGLGNSGMSGGPHLHFNVMDGPDAITARGLPSVFPAANHVVWDQPVPVALRSGWWVCEE